MNWQKLASEIKNQSTKFQLDKSIHDTSIIESEFKLELPQELIDFYRETNGIIEVMSEEKWAI